MLEAARRDSGDGSWWEEEEMRLQVPYDPGLPDAECASRCCDAWGISEVVSDVLTACSAAGPRGAVGRSRPIS